jgi:hypothetical protein
MQAKIFSTEIHKVAVDIWKSHERQDCKDKQNNQTIVSEMVS